MPNYSELLSEYFYLLKKKKVQNINISIEEKNTSLFGLFIAWVGTG